MTRTTRVHDGWLSGLMRERSRARRATLAPDPGGPPVPETPSNAPAALLVMDLQNAIVARLGDDADAVLDRAAAAVAAARANGGARGIATSGVVLSTLRQAADLDYRLTVLRDACADADAEVHRVLTEKVFPRQADVVDVAHWVAAPTAAAPAA